MVPPPGVFKINCDAAVDETKKLMGVSIIVWDHKGQVLATICSSKPYITNPTIVEAHAAWKVEKFGTDLGLQNIIIEGDALKIVQNLQKDDPS